MADNSSPGGNAYLLMFLLIVLLLTSFVLAGFSSILGSSAPIDLDNLNEPDSSSTSVTYWTAFFDVLLTNINGAPLFVNLIFWIIRVMIIYLLIEVLWIG